MKTTRISLSLIFLISLTTTAHADAPDWVRNFGVSKRHPSHSYLVGFGSAQGNGAESRQIAADNARAEVSRHIVINIKSVISTGEEETRHGVSEHFSATTQSSTALQLMGLSLEHYDGQHATYVLAWISRAELKRLYTQRAVQLRAEIRRILADAHAAENEDKISLAVEKYLSTAPLYEALKEAETILTVAKLSSRRELQLANDAFAELERATKGDSGVGDSPLMSHTEVMNRVEHLVTTAAITSVDDIARAVVFQLSKQVSHLAGKVLLVAPTYQDTQMNSRFSREFRAALEAQLGQIGKWHTVTEKHRSRGNVRPRSAQLMRDFTKSAGATLLLSGTYWENSDAITLRTTLRDVDTGAVKAGTAVTFSRLTAMDFKPQNWQAALISQKAFAEGEFVSGALRVEVWTNSPSVHPLYTEGETMLVSVRVNQAAYIRILYILADGRHTLLYDNYYIDRTKVNRVVEIPEEFECAEPFGAELLIVAARTEKFPVIETYESDGYLFLKAADAEQAARAFRGMKKKQQRPDAQQSEARLVITTLSKNAGSP